MAQIRVIGIPRFLFRSRTTKAAKIEALINAELLRIPQHYQVITMQFLTELEDATPRYCIIRLEKV